VCGKRERHVNVTHSSYCLLLPLVGLVLYSSAQCTLYPPGAILMWCAMLCYAVLCCAVLRVLGHWIPPGVMAIPRLSGHSACQGLQLWALVLRSG